MVQARILRFVLAFAVLVGVVTAVPAQPASASTRGSLTMLGDPNTAPQGYDHILCYNSGFTNPFTPVNVKLRDQFYTTPFTANI